MQEPMARKPPGEGVRLLGLLDNPGALSAPAGTVEVPDEDEEETEYARAFDLERFVASLRDE